MAPVATPAHLPPTAVGRGQRRARASVLVTALVLIAALLPPLAPAAYADAGLESTFVSAANDARAGHGLPALSVSGDLTSAARAHSRVMGTANNLHHNPNLASSVGGWQKLGENVGRGPSVDAIHRALMNSPSHRANILGSDWTQIGVGVVVVDGTIWVTQMFRQPSGASAPAPAPDAEPTPAPPPEPEPEQPSRSAPSNERGDSPTANAAPTDEDVDGDGDSSAGDDNDPQDELQPHEVPEHRLSLDRTSLLLARQDAREREVPIHELLAELDELVAA